MNPTSTTAPEGAPPPFSMSAPQPAPNLLRFGPPYGCDQTRVGTRISQFYLLRFGFRVRVTQARVSTSRPVCALGVWNVR